MPRFFLPRSLVALESQINLCLQTVYLDISNCEGSGWDTLVILLGIPSVGGQQLTWLMSLEQTKHGSSSAMWLRWNMDGDGHLLGLYPVTGRQR